MKNGSVAAYSAESSAESTIVLLRTASLGNAAQQEIERMILAGEIAPGAKLTEAWLVQKLGISRGPIREAFRRLEEAGLLRQEKNRGVFVRDIPVEEAGEIFDLRAAMDELVGRRLAQTVGAEQLKPVRAIVARMRQAARSGDTNAYYLLNLEFHDTLVQLAGNRKLVEIYRKLVKELALFRRRNLLDRAALLHSAAEHSRILEAIAAGDPDAAGRAMFEHVMQSKRRMLAAASRRAARAAGAGSR